MNIINYYKLKKIYIECKIQEGYFWEGKTKKLSLEDWLDEYTYHSYPTFGSAFCGAVNRLFVPLVLKIKELSKEKILVITNNKLQSEFIMAAFNGVDDILVMTSNEYRDRCEDGMDLIRYVYANVRHIFVYCTEDVPFHIRSWGSDIWQFIDKSQKLPVWEGKWTYSYWRTNYYYKQDNYEYNVGIMGNENIQKYVTSLCYSKLPEKYVNNGFDGPRPQLVKIDNNDILDWIIEIIQEFECESIAILLQRDFDVRKVYSELVSRGIKIEVKYKTRGDVKDTINFNTNIPKLLTYYCSKGLMFDTVIIPINYYLKSKRLITIAMSAACNNLFIAYEQMPDILKGIPESLYDKIEYEKSNNNE